MGDIQRINAIRIGKNTARIQDLEEEVRELKNWKKNHNVILSLWRDILECERKTLLKALSKARRESEKLGVEDANP